MKRVKPPPRPRRFSVGQSQNIQASVSLPDDPQDALTRTHVAPEWENSLAVGGRQGTQLSAGGFLPKPAALAVETVIR